MADAKEEIYKYVRDRHDKLLLARVMAQTRVGHLLVLTGFLITALVSTGVPQLTLAIDGAKGDVLSWLACGLAILALATTFVFIGMLVYELCQAVSRFAFALPDADPTTIKANINFPGLTADELFPELANQYLAAIEANGREGAEMGKHLRGSFRALKAALIAGAVFVSLLLFARIVVSARAETKQEIKAMSNESNKPAPVPPQPAPATPAQPAATKGSSDE